MSTINDSFTFSSNGGGKNQGNVIIQIDSKHCNQEMNSFVEI